MMTDIVDRLKASAEATVRASLLLARAKTERNQAAGDVMADYRALSFDETIEAAAIAEIESLRHTEAARRRWLREAKQAEGFDDDTSFDKVWVLLRAERDRLLVQLKAIIDANDGFRKALPPNWQGDPVDDACNAARPLINSARRRQSLPAADDAGNHIACHGVAP